MISRKKIMRLIASGMRFSSSNQQLKAMSEKCFLVSPTDEILGTATKRECHIVQSNGTIPLHRAFSVFLFNKEGHLLLQQRSAEKITYPNYYTNSCCSHPIADVDGEDDETDNIGIKKAAQRRLKYELGIPIEAITFDKMTYITRIYYRDEGDGNWGEHEIDYVLFVKADLPIYPNPSEISRITFVPRESIDHYVSTLQYLTPWFRLIYKSKLKQWWDNLDSLENVVDHKSILKLY